MDELNKYEEVLVYLSPVFITIVMAKSCTGIALVSRVLSL
jgi:hypothetical protein